jgi:hypothetical protein
VIGKERFGVNDILRILGFVVIGLFFVLGAAILFTDYFSNLPLNYRIIFAVLLIAYGGFRLTANIFKPKKDDEEDSN